MKAAAMLLLVGCATTAAQEVAPPRVMNPADAQPGERDLAKLVAPLAQGLLAQPYGRSFAELYPKGRAPTDKTGLGEAETHPALKNDPIEIQAQQQFLEETWIEARYGNVSLRIVRQFRYGKVVAAQLVLDRIGRDEKSAQAFAADLAALVKAWPDPALALGVGDALVVTRNDLSAPEAKRPLRVVFERKGAPR